MNRFAFAILITSCALTARAYEIETHGDLSLAAAGASLLGNADARARIGLKFDLNSRRQMFNSSQEANLTVAELISRGSRYEDDFPRSVHHFFDPRNNSPLYLRGEDFPSTDSGFLDAV